ncbi:preprotein translocase subunit SecE [Persicimonas caeni]|uniref:Protein translocase subunit SecE n=1 Tax=Persicimonas caeni TaxID=2292766 RepID=A0A4Y6PVX5_PERCE|nr:preprotein translocase subunit SecE [Persicimonas caeni]QDG52501.1 preprotein translocase subunit SecE [Persicimonas caeni]QED33723.1 preprotein translocase subunit SecE [Persicimonas caeni]
MDVSRLVNLVYVGIAILTFVIADKALEWLWSAVEALPRVAIIGSAVTLPTVIAAALTIGLVAYLYRRKDVYSYLSEVVIELKKVTWPSWNETKRSTLIVIVFTVLLSVFLWGSDQIWSFLTDMLLTPGT